MNPGALAVLRRGLRESPELKAGVGYTIGLGLAMTAGRVIVPVLIGALRRADRMAMALELRGFNSGRPRTTYLRARAGRADAVAGTIAVATAAGYVALWATGVGRLALLP